MLIERDGEWEESLKRRVMVDVRPAEPDDRCRGRVEIGDGCEESCWEMASSSCFLFARYAAEMDSIACVRASSADSRSVLCSAHRHALLWTQTEGVGLGEDLFGLTSSRQQFW